MKNIYYGFIYEHSIEFDSYFNMKKIQNTPTPKIVW